jgi:antitoxin VapB
VKRPDHAIRGQTLLKELAAIRRRWSALPVRDRRSPDDIVGYDENGLPENGLPADGDREVRDRGRR